MQAFLSNYRTCQLRRHVQGHPGVMSLSWLGAVPGLHTTGNMGAKQPVVPGQLSSWDARAQAASGEGLAGSRCPELPV